ncbi:MAG: TerD family protein [Deltaproteobacteria bacterium]|jgi:tellurium resistance protein TerD|nr:TerD family protein [Deltaproteobacteria bacterium]
MVVSLSKGANVSLLKEVPNLKEVSVGLGWDARATTGEDFDLDASAFLLKADGKVRKDEDFIFYNNLLASDGSVKHAGDDPSGGGEGDNEVIEIYLDEVPPEITRVAITVTIHDYEKRKQNFGMVSNAYVRVVNLEDGREIARFDLSEEMGTETAMIFAEVYRHKNEWKFKAVGQGFSGGLLALCDHFGVDAAE